MRLPRMYTLGSSPLFLLVSHEIAKLSDPSKNIPNLILLLSDPLKLKRFLNNDSKIVIRGNNVLSDPIFQYMAACTPPTLVTNDKIILENLVIMERNPKKLLSDLKQYKDSLNNKSNVLLINPPMGILETLENKIWDDSKKPKIFLGLTDKDEHFLTANKSTYNSNLILNTPMLSQYSKEFSLQLNPLLWGDKVRLMITQIPTAITNSQNLFSFNQSMLDPNLKEENDLIYVMSRLNKFNTSIIGFIDFQFLRLEKCIMKSCIESLATLYDCKYIHELLMVRNYKVLLKVIISEQIEIISKSYPYLLESSDFQTIFNVDRLYELIIMRLQNLNAKSRAYKDMQRSNLQMIDDLNGYFVDLGYKNKINCKWNKMLSWLLKGKLDIKKQTLKSEFHM